jgi:phage-related protein
MAREFVMGARINLNTGNYSSGMSDAMRSTSNFSQELSDANRAMGRYYDSAGRMREANGRFVSTANQAEQATGRQRRTLAELLGITGRFSQATRQSTQQLQAQERQVTSLRERVFSLQGAFIALTGSMAIKGAYNWLIGANADMEQYQNTLTVVLGSQEKAVEQMAWAEKFAAKTPFEIPSIIEATTRLESYGIESQKVLGITGDMASVMGKDLMQAVEAVADAQTGELERLKEFGITKGMIEEQAKAMGKAVTNNKGQITDQEQFNKTLFAIMEKRFKGGMEMQSQSFKGMLSNVQDFVGSMGRQLGKPLFEKAKAGLQDFLGFLNGLNDSGAIDKFVSGVQIAGGMIGTVFKGAAQILGAVFGPVLAPIVSGFQWLGKAAKDLYTMLFTTGEAPWLVTQFGPEKVNAINNFFWDIYDAAIMFKNFMTGTVGPAIGSAVDTILNAVKGIYDFFVNNWSTIGPYIIGVATAFLVYTAYLRAAAAVTKIVAAAQLAYNAVMAMNPIILVVLAIGLLIGYLIHLAGGWDVVREKLAVLWTYLVNAWNNIWTTLQPILTMIGQKAVEIWQYLVEVVPPLLLQLWTLITTWFNNIWATIGPLLQTIWTGIVNVFNSIVTFFQVWGPTIWAIIQIVWAYISAYIGAAIQVIWAIIKGGFTVIYNIISGIWKMIQGVIEIAWSLITGWISIGLSVLSGDWEGAWNGMLDMLGGVWDGIVTFFDGLKDLFFDSGKAIIQTLADGIMAVASAPVDAITNVLGKVREFLPFSDAHKGPLSQLTHNGGKIVSTMAEGVYKQAGTLHRAMRDTLEDTPTTTTVRANAHRVNPAGKTAAGSGGGRSTLIKSLIEKIIINGVDKNGKVIAEEIIEALYEKLSQADDILSAADLEGLLYD